MALQRRDQCRAAFLLAPGLGQQQALDLDRDAGLARRCLGDHAPDLGLDLDRVFLRDHAPVELEHHLARHHVGVGAALDPADVEVGMLDPFHC